MFKKKKILALIPARSGSKGIKNKNMQKIGDRSLIAHTVSFLNSIKYIDHKVISTDSDIYIKEAKKYGLNNYLKRSKILSNDNASIIDVVSNVIKKLEDGENLFFDYLILLEPTSPFRKKNDILNCLKIAINNNAQSVFTVSKLDSKYHPFKILKKNKQKINFFSNNGKKIINKQDIKEDFFFRNGVCYILNIPMFKKQNKIIGDNSFSYFINREIADIDSKTDLLWSKFLYEKYYKV